MSEQKYLSKPKAARRLDVSEKTIDRLRAAGQLHSIKPSDPAFRMTPEPGAWIGSSRDDQCRQDPEA